MDRSVAVVRLGPTVKALDFTEAEVKALAALARESGLEQLANDCDDIAAGRSTLIKCFPVQAAINAWRNSKEGQK